MWNRLITLIFALVALLIAMDAFQQWRIKRNPFLIPAFSLALFTTIALYYQWTGGLTMLGLTLLVRIVAGLLPASA